MWDYERVAWIVYLPSAIGFAMCALYSMFRVTDEGRWAWLWALTFVLTTFLAIIHVTMFLAQVLY